MSLQANPQKQQQEPAVWTARRRKRPQRGWKLQDIDGEKCEDGAVFLSGWDKKKTKRRAVTRRMLLNAALFGSASQQAGL